MIQVHFYTGGLRTWDGSWAIVEQKTQKNPQKNCCVQIYIYSSSLLCWYSCVRLRHKLWQCSLQCLQVTSLKCMYKFTAWYGSLGRLIWVFLFSSTLLQDPAQLEPSVHPLFSQAGHVLYVWNTSISNRKVVQNTAVGSEWNQLRSPAWVDFPLRISPCAKYPLKLSFTYFKTMPRAAHWLNLFIFEANVQIKPYKPLHSFGLLFPKQHMWRNDPEVLWPLGQ